MSDINTLSPYVRFAIDQRLDHSWRLDERIIYDYELLYIKEGSLLIKIEGIEYYAEPGDIFIFKPNKRHSMRVLSKSGFRQPHIHFDLNYLPDSKDVVISFKAYNKMTEDERQKIRPNILDEGELALPDKIKLQDTHFFEEMLFDIIAEFENRRPFYEINIKALFIRLFTYLLRENYLANHQEYFSNASELIKIRDFLSSNTDRPVQLDEIITEFGISKYHLVRSFKKMYGESPIHYHQKCRLEKAKEMILFTNVSLERIAEKFGFECYTTFTRAFNANFGFPPSSFRYNK